MNTFMVTMYFQSDQSLEDIDEQMEELIPFTCDSIEVTEVD